VLEHSLVLPEDQEAIVTGKLDAITQKIDALGHQFNDLIHLSTVVNKRKERVEHVSGKTNAW
jgi:hypothetical protein